MNKTKILFLFFIYCFKATETFNPDPKEVLMKRIIKEHSDTIPWPNVAPKPYVQPGLDVPHGSKLRRILQRQLYGQDTDGSSIINYLLYGEKPKASPLNNYKTLDPASIKKIAEKARDFADDTDPSAIFGEIEFAFWERQMDFYSTTNRTIDGDAYNPLLLGNYFSHPEKSGKLKEKLNEYRRRFNQGPKNLVINHTYIDRRMWNPFRSNKTNLRASNETLMRNNSRRVNIADTDEHVTVDDSIHIMARRDDYSNQQFKNFMMQALYATRAQITRLLQLRQRFADDVSYRMAILYANAIHATQKLKVFAVTASRFYWTRSFKIKFLPFLVVYEKALAAHTDLEATCQRMFREQEEFTEMLVDHMYVKSKSYMDKMGIKH